MVEVLQQLARTVGGTAMRFKETSKHLSVVVHIPAQGEQSFRFNVNTHSGRT